VVAKRTWTDQPFPTFFSCFVCLPPSSVEPLLGFLSEHMPASTRLSAAVLVTRPRIQLLASFTNRSAAPRTPTSASTAESRSCRSSSDLNGLRRSAFHSSSLLGIPSTSVRSAPVLQNSPFSSINLQGTYTSQRRLQTLYAILCGDPSDNMQGSTVLDNTEDLYGGVIISAEGLPAEELQFTSALNSSLALWKAEGKRGLWLKVCEAQN
jgi:hypothetical protein